MRANGTVRPSAKPRVKFEEKVRREGRAGIIFVRVIGELVGERCVLCGYWEGESGFESESEGMMRVDVEEEAEVRWRLVDGGVVSSWEGLLGRDS